ncbi:PAS domain S-box family protein [Ichthyophthirius multifiliis]|uniref:PAS domain S-box family protein n=1 Tax=Ichthyophthirius multifiliis TaxID=5932 RepID=G0QVC2_ICHMU|nr:PAS domain S-box family protein [Ichthyophthirius multifiliis]EGR30840.1 PAS domain S-box family protein [Ichthyophthirius multifiliis]|eukprot:XP_004032427.1 PAS domain S-box family protein [Ichthyophthirius multifiliis]
MQKNKINKKYIQKKNLYFATAMDYLQMHSFPFHQKITHIWKATDFLKIIFDFFYLFNINKYMPRINYFIFITSVYFLDFIIFLIILDIIFVSYSFSKKKFSTTWPLTILRSVASLLVTVFFLPITETLVSVVQCSTNEQGQLGLDSFPEVICWEGWHLFHALISSLFNLIFMFLSTIVALTYFQPKQTSEDRTARQDSKGEVAFILNKVVCQCLFSFIPEGNDWFLVILVFVLSLGLHWVYNMEDPYYDQEVGLFYKIVSTYYLWTNANLLISQILTNIDFNGGLISWLIGLPFIVLIMITTKKSRIDTLIRSQMKFRSGEQIQGHLRYVLQLIGDQKKDKNAYILLIGYVEKHKETCQEEDCPLKRINNQQQGGKKKQQQQQLVLSEMDDICNNLIKEIDRIYQNGLKKFPTCTKLRISYAFFLMERFQNKREKCFQQLKIAEKTKPSFDEQFIIYRYKKILEENLDQIGENEENENDIVKLIAFDSHIQQCEEYMKLSAQMHKEFWAELKEENPGLLKLNIIGSKISKAVHEAKSHYYDMQKINSKIHQTIKTFGKYLIYVLNDRENGKILLEKAEFIQQQQEQVEKKEDNIEKIFDFKSEPIAYLVVKNKKGEIGHIEQCNMLFSALFGYQKEEVQNKQIQVILPNIYVEIHQQFLQRYYENVALGITNSNYLNENQYSFGKNRNGYIFPLFYYVSVLTDDFQMFLCNFNADCYIKQTFYVLTNQDGVIIDISQGSIYFLGLEVAIIKKKSVNICTFVPDWKDEKKYYEKNGKEFSYNVVQVDGNVILMHFQCHIQALKVEINQIFDESENFEEDNKGEEEEEAEENEEKEKKGEIMGFQFKIEKIEKNINFKIESNSLLKKNNKIKNNLNQFTKENENLAKLVFDLYKDKQQIEHDFSNQFPDQKQDYEDESFLEKQNFKDFSKGIKTKRLFNNRIDNIFEGYYEEEVSEDQENSVFVNQIGEKYEDEEDYHIFNQSNSTEVIRKALNNSHKHQLIKGFLVISLIWNILVIGLSVFEYFFCLQRLESFELGFRIVQILNSRIFEVNKLVTKVIDKQQNLYQVQQINTEIDKSVQSLIFLNEKINNQEFDDFLHKKSEKINFIFFQKNSYLNSNQNIDLNNVILLMGVLGDSDLLDNQGFLVNFFNGIYQILKDQSVNAEKLILSNIQKNEIELILSLLVTFIVCFLAISLFILITIAIKNQRESILFLFLDIPQKHVYYLYKHCDKFLQTYVSIRQQLQKSEENNQFQEGQFESSDESEQDDEIQFQQELEKKKILNNISQEENQNDSEIQKDLIQKRKKIIQKYMANKYQGAQGLIFNYIFILIFTLTYSIINFYIIFNQKNTIQFIWPQYYQIDYMQINIAYYLNIQKIMLIKPEFNINGITAQNEAQNLLQNLLGQNELFTNNMYDLKNQYFNIFYRNPCQIVNFQNINLCESIINGNIKLGVNNVIQHYYNVFQSNLSDIIVKKLKFNEINMKQQYIELGILFFINIFFNFNKKQDQSLYNYVRPCISYLIDFEQQYIQQQLNSAKSFQALFVSIFSILLILSYLIFWIPKISSMNTQLNRTIQMLNMIPINVIKENINIRRFVKNLIKQMDKTKYE